MTQRTIIITGGSDGIGAQAARQIAGKGHRIILVGRSRTKGAAVAEELGCEFIGADYARLADVRKLAADIRSRTGRIDVLANNAGAILGERALTEDGHEKTFQVNVLAPFLLTTLVLDLLRQGDGVVVNTSSASARLVGQIDLKDLQHEHGYSPLRAYGDAKLANILLARGLDARYAGQGISAVAFDPGNIRTNFASETNSAVSRVMYRTPLARIVLTSSREGGRRLAYFVEGQPGRDWEPGGFYSHTKPAGRRRTNPQVDDAGLVDALWRRCEELSARPGSSPSS
ncbi:oxidoreductase [Kineosporia mesophila]|uniref:Oxidoreductase n=1 Tax=Kineosporia mesophila TaxID=566012 RepID=A0ABP6ZAY3_9ACTN|nr:SDR family NAD(P)-dependent oxidoreductase [Kineosporia mesophila]MCD5351978.1 SDR family NAD(P)-dependent oxidoreductase [Kineosporia mesophila]